MWNYGKLDNYEYAKYIEKMIDPISYRTEEVAKLLLLLHGRLTSLAGVSSVSLRDIERYRSIFKWFYEKLPKKRFGNLPLHRVLEERAFVMSMYFCYLLRLR